MGLPPRYPRQIDRQADKPVGDLACPLLLLSVDASHNTPSNPANVTLPTQVSLFYVAHFKTGGGNSLRHEIVEFS